MTPRTLVAIRRDMDQSIAAFADRLGISRNTLARYETGQMPIPAYIALAVTAIYRRLDEVDLSNTSHSAA